MISIDVGWIKRSGSTIVMKPGGTALLVPPYKTFWTCDNLPCALPKIISTQGQNHRDVILRGDKPGRRINPTRNEVINLQNNNYLYILLNNFWEPSSLFMRARHQERRFLAYFFAAVGKEVRRQQANLEVTVHDKIKQLST